MSKELTILVPIYNEARTLAPVMDAIVSSCPDAEIIYIDDGSKDTSLEILKAKARSEDIVLTKPNGGKGSAIRMGLSKASGIYTIIQDADLEYHPSQIPMLLREAKKRPHAAIFGSRFLQPNPALYKRYLMGNKVITGFLNLFFGSHLTDSYTCYKLFETEQMKTFPLTARGFELEAELSAYPLKRGIEIHEVPVEYKPRSLEEGKKIRGKDALKGMKTILRIRFLG